MYENTNFRDIAVFLFRYGFITFETQEDAQKILQEVSNTSHYDSLLISFTLVFSVGYCGFVDLLRLVTMSLYQYLVEPGKGAATS